jgi:murein DD-endopeptidase MepM/ murein hydrolase activator NlpD
MTLPKLDFHLVQVFGVIVMLVFISGGFKSNKVNNIPPVVIAEVPLNLQKLKFIHPLKFEKSQNKQSGSFDFNHDGIDIAVEIGTSVYASLDGLVTEVVDGFDNNGKKEPNYFYKANYIFITHANGLTTRYVHLNKGITVQKGQTVKQGEQIAQTGNSGMSTGPHLHYGVFNGNEPLNPQIFINKTLN